MDDWNDDERPGVGGGADYDWLHLRQRFAPARYRGVIGPAICAVFGLALMFVPSVYLLGLVFLLGGVSAVIITACLTFLGG